MKKFVLALLLVATMSLCVNADDYVSIQVDCSTPGSLSTLISDEQQLAINELVVSGSINGSDLSFIDKIISKGRLKVIDLGEANYSDEYTKFYFAIPKYSAEGDIVGYGKVNRISMPKSEFLFLDLGPCAFIDTVCVNSKKVASVYGDRFGKASAAYDIKKVILNDGVETLESMAFIRPSNSPRREAYVVDKFPSTLKNIERLAVYYYNGHVDGEPSEPGCIINPMAMLTEGLEIVGHPDLKTDYNGNCKNSWTSEKVFIKEKVVKLPSTLKVLNSYMSNNYYNSHWSYHAVEIECDTLIIPKMDLLAIKATADVVICYSENPRFWDGGVTANKIYVPKDALYSYLKASEAYQYINPDNLFAIEEVASISLIPEESIIKVGQTTKLRTVVLPEDALNKHLSYWSADSTVAVVNSNGIISGVRAGQTHIYGKSNNGIVDSCTIEVSQPVTGVSIKQNKINLNIGKSIEIEADVQPKNATNKRVRWSSTNPQIIYINNSGIVTALSSGLAMITVTTEDGGYSAECLAISNSKLDDKTIQPTLEVGTSIQLSLVEDNITETNVSWKSSNPEVAAVDSQGKVWFNSAGNVLISAECGDLEYSTSFDVEEVVARGLNVFPVEAVGGVGHQFSLLALHEPENTTDKSVTWVSSDPDVATVSEDGRVELASLGSAQITARSGEQTAVCTVTVGETVKLTEMASTGVVIDVVEGGIVVRNVASGESIAVYTVDGKVANGAIVDDEETKLNLAAGIYIVKVSPATVAKVLVK